MQKLKTLLVTGVLALAPFAPLALVTPVHAAEVNLIGELDNVNTSAGLGNQELTDTIGLLIKVLLSFLGVIFLLLIIYAGFLWMTASGDEGKVDKAKDILITSVIGLIILLSAYAISSFVITQLSTATATG